MKQEILFCIKNRYYKLTKTISMRKMIINSDKSTLLQDVEKVVLKRINKNSFVKSIFEECWYVPSMFMV